MKIRNYLWVLMFQLLVPGAAKALSPLWGVGPDVLSQPFLKLAGVGTNNSVDEVAVDASGAVYARVGGYLDPLCHLVKLDTEGQIVWQTTLTLMNATLPDQTYCSGLSVSGGEIRVGIASVHKNLRLTRQTAGGSVVWVDYGSTNGLYNLLVRIDTQTGDFISSEEVFDDLSGHPELHYVSTSLINEVKWSLGPAVPVGYKIDTVLKTKFGETWIAGFAENNLAWFGTGFVMAFDSLDGKLIGEWTTQSPVYFAAFNALALTADRKLALGGLAGDQDALAGMPIPNGKAGASMWLAQLPKVKGDLNLDGIINVLDVQCEIRALFGLTSAACLQTYAHQTDLNCDGVVNVADVQLTVDFALQCQTPATCNPSLNQALDANQNSVIDACEM